MSPIVGLVVAGLCSVACYREATRFETQYGRTPFGWSNTLWAVAGFLLGLLGIVLIAIAERIGRRAAASRPVGYGPPQYGQQQYGQPAYGQPAYGSPVRPAPAPVRPARLRPARVRPARVRPARVRPAEPVCHAAVGQLPAAAVSTADRAPSRSATAGLNATQAGAFSVGAVASSATKAEISSATRSGRSCGRR